MKSEAIVRFEQKWDVRLVFQKMIPMSYDSDKMA